MWEVWCEGVMCEKVWCEVLMWEVWCEGCNVRRCGVRLGVMLEVWV